MRDFFINSFEKLVGVIVILLAIVVVVAGVGAMFGGGMGPMGQGGGFLVGLGILIGGGIYVIFLGGVMYLGLGIYQNTKMTAEAVRKLADRG